ncbi:MAG: DUF1697 domain-containing protein [Ruminococcus sp.]|nr:DUF1697 domain-containing protein [Ruminococcus sp.]
MRIVALLRGVTPVGKNRIPKMSYLVEILTDCGFSNVSTLIQSGNIILDTELCTQEIAAKIHNAIKDKIGADLSVIIKTKADFEIAVRENPFTQELDSSRIHLVFTNDSINAGKLRAIESFDFGKEQFAVGSKCLYMYLPRDAEKKKLNNNYLEKSSV